jgi:hypothetical protein
MSFAVLASFRSKVITFICKTSLRKLFYLNYHKYLPSSTACLDLTGNIKTRILKKRINYSLQHFI